MKRAQMILAGLVAVLAAGCGAGQERREGMGAEGSPEMSRDSATYQDSLRYMDPAPVREDTATSDLSTPGTGKY